MEAYLSWWCSTIKRKEEDDGGVVEVEGRRSLVLVAVDGGRSPEARRRMASRLNAATIWTGEAEQGKEPRVLYNGRLENGGYVAIRLLSLFKRSSIRNLKVRLDLLTKHGHPHLVSFMGYWIHNSGVEDSNSSRIFLVYKYISNGNFPTFLSDNGLEKVLKWSDRLAVLVGVAKAIHFLNARVIPA
ncbi:unnamed protein product [Lactuca virosa]|uniref:Protein kinase domain-containing protein n=1 Tax=Lactuca virosa TaxID=75947 RepID=A0AAU9NCA1_9ASTR|nr:unnamed protein product [Lactuca virosa]